MKPIDYQLYIKQGQALQKLLKKTDLQGNHRRKIEDIEQKIKKARQSTPG